MHLSMFKNARQGGSMTLPYAKLMKRYEELRKLEILTYTEIEEAQWDADAQRWTLSLLSKAAPDRRAEAKRAYEEARKVDSVEVGNDNCGGCQQRDDASHDSTAGSDQAQQCCTTIEADYIVTASAFIPSFSDLPFMRQVVSQYPVHHEGGFPLVTEDLQYGSLSLYVVGMYSALQVSAMGGASSAEPAEMTHAESPSRRLSSLLILCRCEDWPCSGQSGRGPRSS